MKEEEEKRDYEQDKINAPLEVKEEKTKSEWELRSEQEAKKVEELELIYKKSYYKNINSIRKNIQFFFWLTVIPMLCWLAFFLFNLVPF
jgi:hypothetical protein